MSLSGVDLNLLLAFDVLLRERSVTRAAEQLLISQPAMSASLARLRKRLGDPLLVREDQFVVAVDRDHPDVGDHVDLELFTTLPSLAARDLVSLLVETQIDAQGIFRRTEVTTETFVIVPLMVTGTRMLALVQERLGELWRRPLACACCPPRCLCGPWSRRCTGTRVTQRIPAHQWLRGRVLAQVDRL